MSQAVKSNGASDPLLFLVPCWSLPFYLLVEFVFSFSMEILRLWNIKLIQSVLLLSLDDSIQKSQLGNQFPSTSSQRKFVSSVFLLSESLKLVIHNCFQIFRQQNNLMLFEESVFYALQRKRHVFYRQWNFLRTNYMKHQVFPFTLWS